MPTTKEITFYTKAEVQEHNSDNSLWVIIANKVYDLTKFLNEVRFKKVLLGLNMVYILNFKYFCIFS